ncbi:MAG: flagellar hook-basal body complex protein FliE [Capsulimonadaceae bacterium]|nr:flagellar hook-basal body complex protein FliE [Capsulimonadaceae bacterium]
MALVNAIGSGMGDARLQMLPSAKPDSGVPDGKSFSKALADAAEQVNSLQNDAANQAQLFAAGQTNDIHSVMIASQKATVALELTTQVRNKVLEAYQEVMRMSM